MLAIQIVQDCHFISAILTKSKTSLKEMQLMTFKMLAASAGCKYTENELVEKIDCYDSDSASHNF